MSSSNASYFASNFLGKTVIDKAGKPLGTLHDLAMSKGERLPHISSLIVKQGKGMTSIPWAGVDLFNVFVIAVDLDRVDAEPYDPEEQGQILVRRDILDKQIVDVEGARLVRVNDLKIEGCLDALCVTAVDTGVRGLARRLRQERVWSFLTGLFHRQLPHKEISWQFVQPIDDKMTTLALTVTRDKLGDMHPADLAEIIAQLPHEEAEKMLLSLNTETAGEALAEMEPEVGCRLLSRMEKEHASDILEEMAPDEAADVLADLPDDTAQELLGLMDTEDAEKVQELLEHEEDTAGGLMINEFIALPPSMSAEAALGQVRAKALDLEMIYYVYVLDDSGKLQGVTSLREILGAKPLESLQQIMSENFKTVNVDTPADDVLEVVEKYGLWAVPVLDKDGTMAGVVTADDVLTHSLRFALRWKRFRAKRRF
ncbi:magnesium transporter [Fundidesulfovibrio terrae]|uniref:magnesium transporter n=1 Tax=Fundidesulfovibrio terrae TaxID=2922866 RepID=UPI001FAF900D|nr:CBS domain-containing protein [Fundidesulfovibrio terrae]